MVPPRLQDSQKQHLLDHGDLSILGVSRVSSLIR
jgi:hypothetical protein